MKKIILLFAFSLLVFSCKETKKETVNKNNEVQEQEDVALFKSVEIEIEGMTCEIGCAKTIQSKVFKMDGVTYSNVSFKTKTGQFTYNENKISKEDIVKKITGIGGGDLYKATKTTYMEEIIEKTE